MKVTKIDVRNNRENRRGKTRVFVMALDRDALQEDQLTHRQAVARMKRAVIPKVLEQLGVTSEHVKAGFSQKAGCACGCSPGFVLDAHWGQEVFVDVASE
ncbi:MAG: hypothetical protein LC650_03105 [Actinobacteria bacterium]|nr:hypothetical protein [Actinomycetota bacterium]